MFLFGVLFGVRGVGTGFHRVAPPNKTQGLFNLLYDCNRVIPPPSEFTPCLRPIGAGCRNRKPSSSPTEHNLPNPAYPSRMPCGGTVVFKFIFPGCRRAHVVFYYIFAWTFGWVAGGKPACSGLHPPPTPLPHSSRTCLALPCLACTRACTLLTTPPPYPLPCSSAPAAALPPRLAALSVCLLVCACMPTTFDTTPLHCNTSNTFDHIPLPPRHSQPASQPSVGATAPPTPPVV